MNSEALRGCQLTAIEASERLVESDRERWTTDPAGQAVYYPFGPAASGYIVADDARERALKEADRYFKAQVSRMGWLISGVLIFALTIANSSIDLGTNHPILTFFGLGMYAGLLQLAAWRWRQPVLGPLLQGLPRVPPVASSRRALTFVVCAFPVLLAVIYLALRLYDLQLDAEDAKTGTLGFYPSISLYLLGGGAFILLPVFAWTKTSEVGIKTREIVCLLLLALVPLGCIGGAVWNFCDPQPSIILSREGLDCDGKRVLWADIRNLDLREKSAWVKFAPHGAASAAPSTAVCRLRGLNVPFTQVFEAMRSHWRTAHPTPAIVPK